MIYTQIRYLTFSEHGKCDRRTETVFGSVRNLLLKMIDSPGSVAKPLARLRLPGSLVLGTFHCEVKLLAATFVSRNTARREG